MSKNDVEVLNLDDFAKIKKVVKLHGKDYSVEEMSVEDFIEVSREAKRLEALGERLDEVGQVEAMIKLIRQAIPSLPEETARKLKVPQLAVLIRFINGELQAEMVRGAEQQAAAEADGKEQDKGKEGKALPQ